ncbi:hypothetical protein [Helicobacter anatolicus]|uniref:hypothetical protein n=1 Tax=Helicobacter anatolicus TaxID=2905874 RepID=UPI001E44A46E|nr:hypothetical protein [Helicobacter anatolicus]MCE3037803.1 hypothetical protein [Helicobacter anatolicus]
MGFCKILKICYIYFSLIGLIALQGCGILTSDIAKRKFDNTLPVPEEIRTINDVTSIGLEWKMPENLEEIGGYVIYENTIKKNENSAKSKIIAIIKNPFATHYYIQKLKPQTDYSYQIASLGKNNTISIKSPPINIKTSYIDPVENIFASKDLPKQIKIFWSPHNNPSIKRYIIERKTQEGKFLKVGIVPHRLYVEFFDKDLEDGKVYSYRVISESYENAKSLPSAVVTGSTRKKPLGVQNLQASTNLVKSILITWNLPENLNVSIKNFKIFTSHTLNGKFSFLAQTQDNFYKVLNLKDGEIRYYKVISVDADGIESEMNIGAIQGNALPPPPTPKILSATIINNQAVLKWEIEDDTRNIINFKVCRSENNKNQICFDNIMQQEFIDKEMQPNIKYQYDVRSVDEYNLESLPTPIQSLGF